MAIAVEALIAAAYLDGGEEALVKVVATLELDHEFLTAEVRTLGA